MHIAFIVPRIADYRPAGALEPLVFGLLSRLTPPDHTVRLFDENIEDIDWSFKADIAAFTVHSFSALRAYRLAKRYRETGTTVVMGGIHPSLLPNEAAQHADCVVVGDCEDTWTRVVNDIGEGRPEKIYRSTLHAALGGVTADRSIYKGKRYGRIAPVYLGRGCTFSCDFCSVHSVYKRQVRHRPVHEVLEEIETLLRRRVLFFTDDNLSMYGASTRELLEGLARLRVSWIGQMSVDNAYDDRMLSLLKRSGCIALLVGFESLSAENLQSMGKSQNLRDDFKTAVKRMQRSGIMVAGSFMFGNDNDTPGSVGQVLTFAESTGLALAHFNPIHPLPGTQFYSRLAAEGRLTDTQWWLSPSYRYGSLPFAPKSATAFELQNECFAARRKFNTMRSILRRAFGAWVNCFPPVHLVVFLWANLFSRREIYAKQEIPLG
jgi:radical SAM superfamily enzyme YgiQ (UPF0313 family)